MDIALSIDAFTKMVSIVVEDEFTHQVLVVTPGEARQIAELLASIPEAEPADEREAANLRCLTIYNGHSLPSIDRESWHNHVNFVGQKFHFDLIQITETEQRKVGEL